MTELSEKSIEDCLIEIESIKSYREKAINIKPSYLIIPSKIINHVAETCISELIITRESYNKSTSQQQLDFVKKVIYNLLEEAEGT